MPNENLQNALKTAGLTVEQFAEIIQVDPKSVQRWVTGPTVPYPRHRARIASALQLSEQDLWPEQTPEPVGLQGSTSPAIGAGDVTGAWAYADDLGAPDLLAFINSTNGPIDVLDCCCALNLPAALSDTLVQQAAAGRKVRILTDGSGPHWESLLTNEQIKLYLCDIPGEYWLIKTPVRMLLSINLEHQPGNSPPPILELTPTGPDGLFHRLADRFEELWQPSKPDTTKAGVSSASQALEHGNSHNPGQDSKPGEVTGVSRRRWPHQPDRPTD